VPPRAAPGEALAKSGLSLRALPLYVAGKLQTPLFPSATLAEFYRFALLLTGSIQTAERVLADALTECETQLVQMRNEKSRQAWFTARLRERCAAAEVIEPAPRLLREEEGGMGGELLEIEAYLMAQRFHRLPEPERTALALFYLDAFELEEIAKLLKLDEEELAAAVGRGRQLLQNELREMRANKP
jgi:DNA-directed RNA polymerase specialized sigma24 family protein